ncbi:hypothetical protein [Luteimonas salinilitoris]|uniref:DUF922 domain-containing protein n=1 Tax=Luteimonas salinilitoris TaxID=3237697 RepID=A0ABV4HRW3_9GAMM
MRLAPANALNRVLRWDDFKRKKMAAPSAGQIVIAAQTAVGWTATPTNLKVKAVKGSKPTVYKLAQEPTTTVRLDEPEMWVASFVFDDWSEARRDALLGHEQIHYLIGALSARDYARDFAAIAAKEYDSSADGIDDITQAMERNSEARAQALQDAYDHKTKHDPTGFKAEQAKWKTAVIGARTTGMRLRESLRTAGLIQ